MPAKKHNFTYTEIKAGILVILSAAVLVGFIVVTMGLRPKTEAAVYFAQFRNTNGLNPNADVRWGGYPVGKVTNVGFDPANQSLIRVELAVDPQVPVNADTIATIEQITLTAEKHLELSTGSQEAARLAPGETIQAVTKSGGLIEMPDVDGVVARVENLLDDVLAFLGVDEAQKLEEQGEEEFAKISRIAADVRKAVNEGTVLVEDVRGVLNENAPEINKILKGVQDIETSSQELVTQLNAMLAENRQPIADSLKTVQGVMVDVDGIIDGIRGNLDSMIVSLQATLDNAEGLSGNLGEFIESNRPAIEDILIELRATVRNLNDFSRTLSEQPYAVIRGAKPEGRQ
ncbi:MAG: MCE family protein [Candidatus Hydrogenedentes bacterium]|nr:MCE family protein [Candidatus Hydrogenedentota bacterium]